MVDDVTGRDKSRTVVQVPREIVARIASGIVLAAVALAAAFAGGFAFSALVLTGAVLMAWEWGRIVRQESDDMAVTAAHAVAVTAGAVLAAMGQPLLGLVAIAIGTAIVLVLAYGRRARWSAAGVLYVGLPAIALIWLRESGPYGLMAMLFMFAIVWTTDTFSYVCGKLIGGPKLWPWLSPNKTWAGTIGGVVCAGVAAVVFAFASQHQAPVAMALTGLVLSLAAQAGDLGESALKRAFNVRNASDLIPGHGGCMDRMDGIVGAATVAAILAALRNIEQPAAALLQSL